MESYKFLLADQERAELVEAIAEVCQPQHIENYIQRWRSCLQPGDNDYAWDWGLKKRLAFSGIGGYECFALVVEGDVQGLILGSAANPYRAQYNERQRVYYVAYVTSAPWNRRNAKGGSRFRRVGATLLALAGKRSHALGFLGYVRLHALSGTELFYEQLGLSNYGPDPDTDNLSYFEKRYAQ